MRLDVLHCEPLIRQSLENSGLGLLGSAKFSQLVGNQG